MDSKFSPSVSDALLHAANNGLENLYTEDSLKILSDIIDTKKKISVPKRIKKEVQLRYDDLKHQLPNGHIYTNVQEILKHIRATIKVINTDSVTYSPLLFAFKEFDACKPMKFRNGNIITGREQEVDTTMLTLCKKNKRGVILVGEPGVGKTAIVQAINSRLIERTVPRQLIGAEILNVDLPYIFSKYKDDPLGVIIGILERASIYDKAILFIDEVHQLLGQRMNDVMKPYLTEKIRFIGSTTLNEYHTIITDDTALERRFTLVNVDEPNITKTTNMILGTKSVFEEHHKCVVPVDVCKYLVETGSRFRGNRKNPDKSLDLLDIACSIMYENEIVSVHNTPEKKEDFLLNIDSERQKIESLKTVTNDRVLTKDYIDMAISNVTGISYGEITNSLEYNEVKKAMNDEVFNQEKAVSSLANVINIFKHIKSDREHPVSILLLVGPAGVGKKTASQLLAKNLFGKKDYFIDFDMSSYKESFTLSELKGSPPGYVGYGKSGVLIKSIRNNPQSVVYFRGIDKAHESIKQYLIDGCRSGKLTDTAERTAKLNNSIIIFSVTLSDKDYEEFLSGKANRTMGFSKQGTEDSTSVLQKNSLEELLGKDLVNSCDEIIIFDSLSQDTLKKIYDLRVEEFINMYSNVDIDRKKLKKTILDDSKNGHDVISKITSEVPKQVFKQLSKK
jgi:ATP-dependent Clp protease ATP-binding subunit ClpC